MSRDRHGAAGRGLACQLIVNLVTVNFNSGLIQLNNELIKSSGNEAESYSLVDMST